MDTSKQQALHLDKILVSERTLIHLRGFPFYIEAGTALYGRESNFRQAMDADGALTKKED